MSLSINGNSLIFNGQITITNFTSTNTTPGVATMTLTPTGGVGTLPGLVAGQPGQAPLLTMGAVTTLASGSSATATLTQTSPGGSGVSSAYTLALGLPAGTAGAAGSSGTIHGASDLNPAGVVGSMITASAVSGGNATNFVLTPFPFGNVLNPSAVTTLTETGQVTGTLCTVTVPNTYGFAWYPLCFASCTVAGTVNTVVNLQATLNAGAGVVNNVVALEQGISGVATQRLSMLPAFGALLGSGYGQVPANTTATIVLTAQEMASTPDAWSVAGGSVAFTVVMVPV